MIALFRLPRFLMRAPLLLLALAGPSFAQSTDIERGKQLHDERCLLCHGLENYQAAASKIKSLDGLREMVRRWEDKLKDPFTAMEREDVVAYLNATFYKFPQQKKVSLQARPASAPLSRIPQ
jgi:mono/diheme cytochrome c family protein